MAMDIKINKKPALGGFEGCYRMLLDDQNVEAAGIEPASASPPPLVLHAYPHLLI
jgi:hypothetical protein